MAYIAVARPIKLTTTVTTIASKKTLLRCQIAVRKCDMARFLDGINIHKNYYSAGYIITKTKYKLNQNRFQ
jgi:hypothetical protein